MIVRMLSMPAAFAASVQAIAHSICLPASAAVHIALMHCTQSNIAATRGAHGAHCKLGDAQRCINIAREAAAHYNVNDVWARTHMHARFRPRMLPPGHVYTGRQQPNPLERLLRSPGARWRPSYRTQCCRAAYGPTTTTCTPTCRHITIEVRTHAQNRAHPVPKHHEIPIA